MEEQTTEDYVEIPFTQPLLQPRGPPTNYHGQEQYVFAPPPPQHIAVNEYEQQRYRQFDTQAPGIPPPPPVFHNDSERFVAYNTGFNAGYVRGYYVAVNNMNNREGQRLHQRYVSRGGGAFGSHRGGGGHSHGNDERLFVPRGRGRGGRGGGGGSGRGGGVPNNNNNNTFVSPSGQHVQILRNVGRSGLSNVHFPPLQASKQPITTTPITPTGDENM